MRKLFLLLPLVFALACEPSDPAPAPVDEDSTSVVVPQPPAPKPEPPVFNDPKTKPGRPVDKTAAAREIPAPVVEEVVGDFCHQGEACDIAGDPVLARKVDPARSTFQMRPDDKAFVPGDRMQFAVCAKDEMGEPVSGLPVIVVVKQTRRVIAGDGLALTGGQGCVTVQGTFTSEDEIGDRTNGVADSGSYLLNAYIGGRLLRELEILHDTI
jgi:hypothetical protein